ncbi:hypothetical protein BABINDRAFT_159161 [Babjeviella inositovora NRRL Y-12698]|uniref:Uncharacterized protein n=1 Tax=Babjeviella inositovora NRRL Y-12698 TaxID=984486 RepID=A0A1E3QYB2_9ASCO|nr:uncharacterized protein BABINDRAFT_159161 [Babjeviella inositovora NRRL Y-12698]ODQ82608.1 hypothetical protein BABINDRAFT_159161 [Babjeviella inositovora NRRL Y-12698]
MNLKQVFLISILTTTTAATASADNPVSSSTETPNIDACSLSTACIKYNNIRTTSCFVNNSDLSYVAPLFFTCLCGLSDEEYWNDAWTCIQCKGAVNSRTGSTQAEYKARYCSDVTGLYPGYDVGHFTSSGTVYFGYLSNGQGVPATIAEENNGDIGTQFDIGTPYSPSELSTVSLSRFDSSATGAAEEMYCDMFSKVIYYVADGTNCTTNSDIQSLYAESLVWTCLCALSDEEFWNSYWINTQCYSGGRAPYSTQAEMKAYYCSDITGLYSGYDVGYFTSSSSVYFGYLTDGQGIPASDFEANNIFSGTQISTGDVSGASGTSASTAVVSSSAGAYTGTLGTSTSGATSVATSAVSKASSTTFKASSAASSKAASSSTKASSSKADAAKTVAAAIGGIISSVLLLLQVL